MNKIYVGISRVTAEPMTRLEYNTFRGWVLPNDERGDDKGFMICDIDGKSNLDTRKGYVSWVTEAEFNRRYKYNELSEAQTT